MFMYVMSAPKDLRASTSTAMGLHCMRSVPVMMCSPSTVHNREVMKRIAVPAALMSMTCGMCFKASSTTLLSSQSEILSMGMSLPLRERIIKALLLILLLEGNCMFVRRIFGANTSIIAGSVRFLIILCAKLRKLFGEYKIMSYLCIANEKR